MTLNSALRQFPLRIYRRLRAWVVKRHTEIKLAARATAAAVASFALVHLLELPQGYWAVFTAILIMQTSLGGSLQAITDRMIGTLGGHLGSTRYPDPGTITLWRGLLRLDAMVEGYRLAQILPRQRDGP